MRILLVCLLAPLVMGGNWFLKKNLFEQWKRGQWDRVPSYEDKDNIRKPAMLLPKFSPTEGVQATQLPTVQTRLGAVTGRVLTTAERREYEAFRGIPYARPPVGELRFAKPQPLEAFERGYYDASQYKNVCWQPASSIVNTSSMGEDCLFLNIFRPRENTPKGFTDRFSSLRPVFIFIHGGGFLVGSSDAYQPGRLVTEWGIVVVTLNYRLGVFGFFSSGDSTLPGNYGLWDQHLAIKWVKNNIRAFGGDPDLITIGGESAGSASVSFHTLSPFSRGLFNRAILQSGSAASAWAVNRNPAAPAMALAKNLSCSFPQTTLSSGVILESNRRFLDCLRTVSPQSLLSVVNPPASLAMAALAIEYPPTVDGEFVRRDPTDLLKDNEYLTEIGFYERDYLSGCVNNEGTILYTSLSPDVAPSLYTQTFYDDDLVPTLINKTFGKTSTLAEDLLKFVYTDPRYSGASQLSQKQVLDTVADYAFYAPLTRFARAVARGQKSGRRNLVYFLEHYAAWVPGGDLGLVHGGDLFYEFEIDPVGMGGNSSLWMASDERLGVLFRTMIGSFVLSGSRGPSMASYCKGGWIDFDTLDESYLYMKWNSLTMQRHLRAEQTWLWLDLLPRLLIPTFSSHYEP